MLHAERVNVYVMAVPNTAQRVADNVRAEVARRKVSQTSLAQLVGIRQQALSRRLNGNTPFRIDELFAIAEALDTTVSELVTA